MEHLPALIALVVICGILMLGASFCAYLKYRCRHKFKLLREIKVHDERGSYVRDDYVLQCERCGRIISESV